MNGSNEDREGLAAMLGDALVEETLEADLLMRYASDPDGLERGERERVERYLDASPAHRQQLRSLVRFAEARDGLGVLEEGSADASSRSGLVEIESHPHWRPRAAMIGGAVAASLLAALLYFGMRDGPGPSAGPAMQLADEGPPASESDVPLAPATSQMDAPIDRGAGRLEQGLAGSDEADPVPSPKTPPVLPEVNRRPIMAEGSPRLKPAPPAPGGVPRPIESRPAPDTEPTRESLLLAMVDSGPLVYARPGDAMELPPLVGLRSGPSDLPVLRALVPDHVARTLSDSPSLYWYLSEDTERGATFSISDRVSVDPLLEITLRSPLTAGIHEVALADHGVVLERGREYRWFVSVSADDGSAVEDVMARGAVLRIEPDADLVAALEAAPPRDQARVRAEHGLWYDALALVSGAIAEAPQDRRLRELRAGLLQGVGLSWAAEHDRTSFAP